jgi:hypothetical protein
MNDFFNTLNDCQKARMYWRCVEGLLNLVNDESDANFLDNADKKEIFDELQNVIFQLRKVWKEI